MLRIGIAGSDKRILSVTDQIRNLGDVEITGFVPFNDCSNAEAFCSGDFLSYPSIDALYHYVDAIILNYDVASDVDLITKCLKNFKHVFCVDACGIKYADITYLVKIAEESNVMFYPEFGEPDFSIPESAVLKISNQLNYLDIHHSVKLEYWETENILHSALLQNLSFALTLIKANVKRINASLWDSCGSDSNILNARLDFDNGSTANILVTSAYVHSHFYAVAYCPAARSEIIMDKKHEKVLIQPYSGEPELFSANHDSSRAVLLKINSFISALNQDYKGLKSLETQLKSIRVNFLIHEKVNNFSSKNILYS